MDDRKAVSYTHLDVYKRQGSTGPRGYLRIYFDPKYPQHHRDIGIHLVSGAAAAAKGQLPDHI